MHSITNTIKQTCVFNWGINKHDIRLTIIIKGKQREDRFSIWLWLMLHDKFANKTQVSTA